MPANQYSASAKAFTVSRFSVISSAKKHMAQSVGLLSGNQNRTISVPATNSAASVMDQENQ